MHLEYIDLPEIQAIRKSDAPPAVKLPLLAQVFRINTLYMVTRAGSGHIGTSFSCLDILTYLWLQRLENPNDLKAERSDLFFSSKGHDVPGYYSLLLGLEYLDFHLIHKLRRLDGLPGHPDVSIPYMLTNTGSLGMGVSKAKGFALARRLAKKGGRIYVLTGDGELQEGQIWESLQPVANRGLGEITLIVDHNKIQSDTYVSEVSDLGDLQRKFAAFGWNTARCDGHDFESIAGAIDAVQRNPEQPGVVIADTVKGKGVPFMQEMAVTEDGVYYKFHSGAPGNDQYSEALAELRRGLTNLIRPNTQQITFTAVNLPDRTPPPPEAEKLVAEYGDELVRIAAERDEIVVLDADLVLDCGLIPFKNQFPDRFLECGIAEQDMCSAAGAIALAGKLPIVHSFACFLTPRANEQIYNNASERTKIIYTGSLAGLVPGGPGHSHQSIRDIALMACIPGMTVVEPSCARETRALLRWAIEENVNSTYIRLISIPVAPAFQRSAESPVRLGVGYSIREGTSDYSLITYGAVMLNEAMGAAAILAEEGTSLTVINMPWLNVIDPAWAEDLRRRFQRISVLDNHYRIGGLGSMLAGIHPNVIVYAVDSVPICGQNPEVLARHGLDAASLAERLRNQR